MRGMRFLFAMIAASILIAVQSVSAQEEFRLQVGAITEETYPEARVIVGLEDASGAALDLAPENWSVSIDGQTVPVTGAELASSDDAPLDVLFVFDASTSLAGLPLDSAKAAGNTLLQELAPEDRVAIMRFNNDVVLLQDYTTDRALLAQAIGALQATGNTAFYQATYDAAVSAGTASTGARKAVVLLSDGAEFGNRSTVTREEALAAAEFVGVPFFIVAFGDEIDRPYLTELATRTKGRLFEAPGPADLAALYAGVGRMLRSQYIINFDASSATPGAAHAVSVSLDADGRTATAETTFTPTAAFVPQMTLAGIEAGDEIKSRREITLETTAAAAKVTWYVDDVNVLEQHEQPYVFTYDPVLFGEGSHELRVALGDGDTPAEQSLRFRSTPPAAPASGGSPTLIYVGIGGLVGLIAAGLFFFLRAKRRPKERVIPADQRTTSWAKQVAQRSSADRGVEAVPAETKGGKEQVGEALGVLISRAGNDLGKQYEVGGRTISLGAGGRCGVRIDDPSLAFEEARVWVRDGHLMLHKFTRLTAMELQGVAGGWEILEPGDTFQIGAHTFEFRLLKAGERAASDAAAAQGAPNVLRDPAAETPPDVSDQPRSRLSDLMPRAD